jgi:hypothetical protein
LYDESAPENVIAGDSNPSRKYALDEPTPEYG